MPLYTDQIGRTIELKQPPQRIISLVPSQTELLFDLDLEKEVIGITKFCVHPQNWFRTKTRIGGTKQLHLDRIKQLNPDLILANKEENVKEQIEELTKAFPVWVSDVNTLPEALSMIESIGSMCNRQAQAQHMIHQIQSSFSQLAPTTPQARACYLIWKDPYMTIGGDTFIHDMLDRAGFENVFAQKTRYPETGVAELHDLHCELLLLSSEPYPFRQKHIAELQKELPSTKIVLVDGEMFSWYGSRLLQAPFYFQQLQQQIQALSLF